MGDVYFAGLLNTAQLTHLPICTYIHTYVHMVVTPAAHFFCHLPCAPFTLSRRTASSVSDTSAMICLVFLLLIHLLIIKTFAVGIQICSSLFGSLALFSSLLLNTFGALLLTLILSRMPLFAHPALAHGKCYRFFSLPALNNLPRIQHGSARAPQSKIKFTV